MNPVNKSAAVALSAVASDSSQGTVDAARESTPTARAPSQSRGASSPGPSLFQRLLDGLINFFTSLKLTVLCLVLGLLLVFLGTLAQVDLGLYKAQNEFFRSFIVFWGPKSASWKIPVLPGGYLVGGILLINLVASHFKRFTFSRDKAGIWMVHFGLILLLLGQLGTDLLSRESALDLHEGEAKNYSEADRQAELAIIDTTDSDLDKVVAIPQRMLMNHKEIRHEELPFVVRIKNFFANSAVDERAPETGSPPAATQGVGLRASLKELPRVTEMDKRDIPSAVIEIVTPQGSLGTWLVSEYLRPVQNFTYNGRTYELALRKRRYYTPYTLQLQQFRHDIYPGTDIPKNFSSRVVLQRPDTGENREVLIYMNNPLRYAGQTYYQASYYTDERGTATVLQVVRNPSWLTPYLSCVLVGLGLIVQFARHLLGFTLKRKTA